jgi:hypothetical protein
MSTNESKSVENKHVIPSTTCCRKHIKESNGNGVAHYKYCGLTIRSLQDLSNDEGYVYTTEGKPIQVMVLCRGKCCSSIDELLYNIAYVCSADCSDNTITTCGTNLQLLKFRCFL